MALEHLTGTLQPLLMAVKPVWPVKLSSEQDLGCGQTVQKKKAFSFTFPWPWWKEKTNHGANAKNHLLKCAKSVKSAAVVAHEVMRLSTQTAAQVLK